MKQHLHSYLHRGQLYFQITCGVLLVLGGIGLKVFCDYYGVSPSFFKTLLLTGFFTISSLVVFQACLHHRYVSEGVSPVSWLTTKLQTILTALEAGGFNERKVQDLEKEVNGILRMARQTQGAHAEVQALVSTLEQIMKLLGEFSAAHLAEKVAHDIRGPLSSLETAVAQFRESEKRNAPFADLLALSAKRLKDISDELLKKYRKGAVAKNAASFSLHEVLDELAGEYEALESCRGVRFVRRYCSQAVALGGERVKLQRAFGNIIKNAVEVMDGAGTITIKTDKEGDRAVVSIRDAGPGMPPEVLDRVLAGGCSEGKKEGHGIGLAVVREVIEGFSGTMEVISEAGKGTEFLIRLPVGADAEKPLVLRCSQDKPVVVLDDDPSIREQWRVLLVSQGVEPVLCESFEYFEQRHMAGTDTAIVDYRFDGSQYDGLQIIKILQGRGFKHLYLCTAEYWKPSLKAAAQKLGVPVIPKPLPEIVIARPEGKRGYRVLVIDDDPSIRLCWEVMQEKLHIETLHLFEKLEDLLTAPAGSVELRSVDIAFVDKNIEGSRYTGAEVVEFLKSRGVAKVVLASGENEDSLRQDPSLAAADFISPDKIPTSFRPFFS